MAKASKSVEPQSGNGADKFLSFVEWKKVHFPQLVRDDKYQALRKDSEQLARTLANDTFDRVQRKET